MTGLLGAAVVAQTLERTKKVLGFVAARQTWSVWFIIVINQSIVMSQYKRSALLRYQKRIKKHARPGPAPE